MVFLTYARYIMYVLFLSGFVFEITPIKINPITSALRWIGHKMNKEITEKINIISQKLDTVERENDIRRINEIKSQIQQFARDIKQADIQGLAETIDIEEYDRVFDEYEEYEKLLDKYGLENGKTTRAMRSITVYYNKRGYGIEKVM